MSHSSLDRSISSYLMGTFCSVCVLFGHLFLLTEVISRLVGFSSGLWLLLGSVKNAEYDTYEVSLSYIPWRVRWQITMISHGSSAWELP